MLYIYIFVKRFGEVSFSGVKPMASNNVALAGTVGTFINHVFAPHAVASAEPLLKRHGLSADKIRQAVLQSLLEAMEQGRITEADLKD